jgi:signal transduction histidine kinase
MQRSEQMRRELVSNISHDLRTPLASIQGYIETLTLKLDQLDDQQKREHLRVALKHSKRLGKLISALFELSKLESTSMKLERTQFSLTELVYDITQEFSLRAEQKNVRIAIDHPQSNLVIDADIGLLERVFQNLIDNALRHTPENGQITIELKAQGDKVSVALADTGSGIAEDELPYIFERYYRANNTTPDAANSSGLGLAIVKRILELHGSSIAVYSKLNEGAKFSFPLKLSPQTT